MFLSAPSCCSYVNIIYRDPPLMISCVFRYWNGACTTKVKFFGQEIVAGKVLDPSALTVALMLGHLRLFWNQTVQLVL